MSKRIWKFLANDRIVITCKNKGNKEGREPTIYHSEYHGCCSRCPFCWGSRGDSWLDDKAGCSAPDDLEYGMTITMLEVKKYRIWKRRKKHRSKGKHEKSRLS